MSALIELDAIRIVEVASGTPRKIAGPWHEVFGRGRNLALRAHLREDGSHVPTESGEPGYISAVCLDEVGGAGFWWAAYDEGDNPDLGHGWEPSVSDAKMRADVLLLAAGWELRS